MKKTCTKCLIEKPFSEFYKSKQKKDGLRSQCKACEKAYREANRERILERQKKYYQANREANIAYAKKYHQANRQAVLERNRKYWYANKERLLEQNKKYRKENEEAIREQRKNYRKLRHQDPRLKFKQNLKTRTVMAFSAKGWSNPLSLDEVVGGFESAFLHIESRFRSKMTWDNYGSWELDHIVPLGSAEDDIHLIELCHFSNIQPLWASENRAKNNKILTCRVEYKDELVYLE